MKINQLFVSKISQEDLQQLLICFGLRSLGDMRMFNKHGLELLDTVNKVRAMQHILHGYYIKCKANLYLSNLSVRKCMTILKQFLRLYGCTLKTYEKNIRNRKMTYYQIHSGSECAPVPVISPGEKFVMFD